MYQRYGSGGQLSPVVSAAISRRANDVRAASALKKATVSILLSLLLLIDVYFCFSAILVNGVALTLLQYAELGAIAVLLLNFLHDFTLYVSIHLMKVNIQLTSEQGKMLGIASPSYGVVPSPILFGKPVSSTPISDHTPVHPHYFMTPTISSPDSSIHSTPHSSSAYSNHTPTSFCGRSNVRGYRASPLSGEPVADSNSLVHYLKQEEEREQRLLRGSLDISSPQGSPSGWYGDQLSNHIPPRKYHIAPRSTSPSSHHEDYDSPHSRNADTSLESCGIKKLDLDQWTERCRKWIALTVVQPLANEISSINSILNQKGRTEQVGMVPIGTLKRIAKFKAQHLPTLSMVIPYLEASAKQEYLVGRLKELAQGSYLSAYRWNSGGNWKGRSWSIDLPTDSQIVMHLLSTYLDSHLPPDPWFPDGKTFSTQYFLKAPPKNGSNKQGVCIIQDNNNPPIYKVLLKRKYIDIPEGRNNLFHSICIFLYHVKEGEKSMLGSINLETAGINILSIISSDE